MLLFMLSKQSYDHQPFEKFGSHLPTALVLSSNPPATSPTSSHLRLYVLVSSHFDEKHGAKVTNHEKFICSSVQQVRIITVPPKNDYAKTTKLLLWHDVVNLLVCDNMSCLQLQYLWFSLQSTALCHCFMQSTMIWLMIHWTKRIAHIILVISRKGLLTHNKYTHKLLQ